MADQVTHNNENVVEGRIAACISGSAELEEFARLMLSGADGEVLATIADDKLSELVRSAYERHETKRPGVHQISVRRVDGLGPDGDPRTIVEIINDDMPFLVDSALGEIQARGHQAYLVLHPIMKVERSPSGTRRRIVGRGDGHWGDGLQESYIFAIVESMSDEAARNLHAALDAIMREVRVAVTDWRAMMSRLDDAIKALEKRPPQIAPGALSESIAFCKWLIDGQFTFLGVREYRLDGGTETGRLAPVADSGLGVLRDPELLVLSKGGKDLELTDEIRQHMFSSQPLIITKSDIRSRIHRRAYMDYIGLKTYGADGQQSGELRLVGLFTSQAYTARPTQIPFLRHKMDAVIRHTGFAPGSHDAKAIINVLEHFPRDELFRIGDRMLAQWAREILDLDLRPRVRLFARRDRFDRFVSALVYVPRERFSTKIRVEIGEALARAYKGHISAFTPFFPEASLIRVHYIVGRSEDVPPSEIDDHSLEAEIADIAQMWEDRLRGHMEKSGPKLRALAPKYGGVRREFPGQPRARGYPEDRTARAGTAGGGGFLSPGR